MITDKIETYCEHAGITVCKFEKLCGLGNGSVGKWRKKGSMPTLPTLFKIENATGIPVHMWIEGGDL